MTEIMWTKRKSVAAVVICVILAVASIAFWQMNQGAQAAILEPHAGLVGWWRFDEGSETLAEDSSGNGNNGAIYGATWVPGRYGQALSFDGSSDYVQVQPSSSLNVARVTITAWIYINSFPAHNNEIMGRDWTNFRFFIDQTSHKLFFIQSTAGTVHAINTPSVLTSGAWYHVACTYDGANLRLYVDGVSAATPVAATGNMDLSSNPLMIGCSAGSTGFFSGTIDEVRIYNRALSAAEIQADFQIGPGFSSNLIAKIPKGTTQVIATLSWQGTGSINATITSPSQSYTEDMIPVYQKTTYSTTGGNPGMLNVKRLSISPAAALPVDQSWSIVLTFDSVTAYQISVEIQK